MGSQSPSFVVYTNFSTQHLSGKIQHQAIIFLHVNWNKKLKYPTEEILLLTLHNHPLHFISHLPFNMLDNIDGTAHARCCKRYPCPLHITCFFTICDFVFFTYCNVTSVNLESFGTKGCWFDTQPEHIPGLKIRLSYQPPVQKSEKKSYSLKVMRWI